MAEEHKEMDPPKIKNERKRRDTKTEKFGETSSSGTSEGKSEISSSVICSEGEKRQTSGATSLSKQSESASSSMELRSRTVTKSTGVIPKTYPKKKNFFASWKSPGKKHETVVGSRSSVESHKESPDKHERPATISNRKKFANKIKSIRKIINFGKISKSCKSDEVQLVDPEADSRPYGEGTSRTMDPPRESEQTRSEGDWEPEHVAITGQEFHNLHGELTTSKESLYQKETETTSLCNSPSLGVENVNSLPVDRMDSHEGSTGDVSSLEKEFEELSSPFKSGQGQKRARNSSGEEDSH